MSRDILSTFPIMGLRDASILSPILFPRLYGLVAVVTTTSDRVKLYRD